MRASSTLPSRAANISGVSQPLANSSDLRVGPVGDRRAPLEAAAVGGGHVVRPRVDVGAGRDEQPRRLGVPLGHRPHQRRRAAPALLRVDVGARLEQHADGAGRCPFAPPSSARCRRLASAARSRSAPALSRRSIIGALPLMAASCSGVTPSRVRAVDARAGAKQQRPPSRGRRAPPPSAARWCRRPAAG